MFENSVGERQCERPKGHFLAALEAKDRILEKKSISITNSNPFV